MERLLPPRPSSSNSCEGEQRFRMERYSFPLIALLIFSSAQRSGVRWDLPTGGRSTRWKKTLHCHHDHDGDGHGHDNHDNDGDDDYDDHGHDDYENCDYHDDHDEHNDRVKLQVKVSIDKWDGKPIWIAGLCYPRPRDGRLSPLLVPFLSLVASHHHHHHYYHHYHYHCPKDCHHQHLVASQVPDIHNMWAFLSSQPRCCCWHSLLDRWISYKQLQQINFQNILKLVWISYKQPQQINVQNILKLVWKTKLLKTTLISQQYS